MFQFQFIDKFLNENECQSLLEHSLKNIELVPAKILTKEGSVVDSYRKSKIGFSKYSEFDFLNEGVIGLVKNHIDINGYDILMNERGYQFTSYETGDYYNWHTDNSDKRYCSVVLQLNDQYTGGELDLDNEGEILTLNKGIGNCAIFLSDTKHRVKEVLSGTRYSLVGWMILDRIKEYKKSII